MFKFTSTISLLLFFLSLQTATAQIVIAPRLQKPGTYKIQHAFDLNQLIVFNDLDFKTTQKQTKVTVYKTSQPHPNGGVTCTETIESLQNETMLPGNIRFSFDSTKSAGVVPLFDVLKNSTIQTIFDPSGNISNITVNSQLDTLPSETQELVITDLKPEILKKRRQRELSEYHLDPVKIGDSWQQQLSVPLGQDSQFLFKTTHLYADTTEQPDTGITFHKVIVTFDEGVFTQGEQLYSMGSPVTIIKASKSYLFDQERGRISKSNLSLSIRGTINSKSKKEVETADFTITMNRNWFIP
ncbi:MAG: hypothetical protein VX738_08950 [Planctomycetota bacterium]|nr:hypothetical protein [Planctomycetota bacterium]